MIDNFSTALVLAPHTDDGELGCGGYLARLSGVGCRVVYLAFSAAETSVPVHLPRDILRSEAKTATAELGVAPEDCRVLDFEVRHFVRDRQAILDKMIGLQRELNPDLVLLPSVSDTHQDHRVVAEEGFRAFKRTTMLAYEVPWNNQGFRANCFISLSENFLQRKIAAVGRYESQTGRAYCSSEYIRSLAVTRGVQVGSRFAEAYEVVRWIMR